MALLNKEEFAAICRTTVGVINTNIHRGKIVYISEDKIIDSEDALNKAFFKKYKKKHEDEVTKQRVSDKVETLYEAVVEKATDKIEKKQSNKRQKESAEKSKDTLEWAERKLQADTLLVEARAEKEKLNLEKLAGKLMPIDLVFSVLNIHNHDILATFQNDAENLASVYCDILANGDRKKLAEITTKIGEKLNNAVNRAKEVALASIENAIEEYQEVRNRGEKK